jgi:hypothetical protein
MAADRDTEISFGKYKNDGLTLGQVIDRDPSYAQWCGENLSDKSGPMGEQSRFMAESIDDSDGPRGDYLAAVGETVDMMLEVFSRSRPFDKFGEKRRAVTFRSDDGSEAVAFLSVMEASGLSEGTVCKVSAKVNDHTEFKGKKQVKLGRVRISTEGEARIEALRRLGEQQLQDGTAQRVWEIRKLKIAVAHGKARQDPFADGLVRRIERLMELQLELERDRLS